MRIEKRKERVTRVWIWIFFRQWPFSSVHFSSVAFFVSARFVSALFVSKREFFKNVKNEKKTENGVKL